MQKPTGKCNIDWREEEGYVLIIALMRFTCCSSEVLQLFMTEIVATVFSKVEEYRLVIGTKVTVAMR